MEIPKFNNQPKVDLEKIPQGSEEFLDIEEQEFGKRENIILEIDGRKIEAVKYYFEYPERIQKATGILGYERTKILDNDFLKFNEAGYDLAERIEKLTLALSNQEYPYKCLNHFVGGYAGDERKKSINKILQEIGFFSKRFMMLSVFQKKKI